MMYLHKHYIKNTFAKQKKLGEKNVVELQTKVIDAFSHYGENWQ